jgi:prepilin-type N-terminal cleavage/methylation domain-containing protein
MGPLPPKGPDSVPRASRISLRPAVEDGITLVEVMIAMSIMGLVMAVFGTTLASVQRAVGREDNLTQTLNQTQLAIQQLDREIRSGNVLYNPALEGAGQASCSGCVPNYTVRVYTQANADTRSTYYCTLWKVDTNGVLWTRQWPPSDPSSAGDWRTVATGIVSRSLGEPAFALDTDPLKGSRTLNVSLAVNDDYIHNPTQTVRVQQALTGRNTSYGYPTGVCATTPSG